MRRFRRRVPFRRSKARSHWVVISGWGAEAALGAAGTNTGVLLVAGSAQAGTQSLELSECTIQRVVGDVIFRQTAAALGLITYGVVVAPLLVGGGLDTAAITSDFDPSTSGEAQRSWLFLRSFYCGAIVAASADMDVSSNQHNFPQGAFIDIRVKRRLQSGQGLALVVKHVSNLIGTSTVNFTANLRTLVTRVS